MSDAPTASAVGAFLVAQPVRWSGMTKPFCMTCADELFGSEAMEVVERSVASAPPFSPEQVMRLRALFADARRRPAPPMEKTCGH